jgi:uncharacterized protein YqeY
MSLEERINKDYIQAMKERNTQKSSAVNYLRAMIKQVKVDKRLEQLDDAEVVSVIRKQIKQRQDSIEQFEKGGRTDLVAKERAELDVMTAYLPAAMSAEDIGRLIDAALAELGAVTIKDMGAVIKLAREKAGPSADGRLLSDLVKEKLSGR